MVKYASPFTFWFLYYQDRVYPSVSFDWFHLKACNPPTPPTSMTKIFQPNLLWMKIPKNLVFKKAKNSAPSALEKTYQPIFLLLVAALTLFAPRYFTTYSHRKGPLRPPWNFKGNTVVGPQKSKQVSMAKNIRNHKIWKVTESHSSTNTLLISRIIFYGKGASEAPLGVNRVNNSPFWEKKK